MPTITVRDVPDPVYRRLKRQAVVNKRSLNDEVLQLLETAAFGARPNHEALLSELEREQQRTPAWEASPAQVKRAMREGRA